MPHSLVPWSIQMSFKIKKEKQHLTNDISKYDDDDDDEGDDDDVLTIVLSVSFPMSHRRFVVPWLALIFQKVNN